MFAKSHFKELKVNYDSWEMAKDLVSSFSYSDPGMSTVNMQRLGEEVVLNKFPCKIV